MIEGRGTGYDHEQNCENNADAFTAAVATETAPRFRSLIFTADRNIFTDEILMTLPDDARVKSYVLIKGDSEEEIGWATQELTVLAAEYSGYVDSDSKTGEYGPRRLFQEKFGHAPQDEDLPLYSRFLVFVFG